MKLSIKETADLVTFSEKILSGKLIFCAVTGADEGICISTQQNIHRFKVDNKN